MAAPTPDFNLQIGLITLPLKKHPVARNATSDAKNLHRECLEAGTEASLGNASRCKGCLKILEKPDIVKGFMEDDGSVTVVTDEEMKALGAENNKIMELVGFFSAAQADHRWYGQADFIGPVAEANKKVYLLFYKRMQERELGALVKYRSRGRDKVGVILPGADSLILFDCYFPAEQRAYADQFKVQLTPITFSPQELTLGDQLIDQNLADFEPKMLEQRDEYWDRVEALREARKQGLALPQFEKPMLAPQSDDLVAALTASINMRPTRAFEPDTTPSKPPVKVEAAKPAAKAKAKAKRA
jgi:DNA end-binding protein Ku